jgi:hypothetical protein
VKWAVGTRRRDVSRYSATLRFGIALPAGPKKPQGPRSPRKARNDPRRVARPIGVPLTSFRSDKIRGRFAIQRRAEKLYNRLCRIRRCDEVLQATQSYGKQMRAGVPQRIYPIDRQLAVRFDEASLRRCPLGMLDFDTLHWNSRSPENGCIHWANNSNLRSGSRQASQERRNMIRSLMVPPVWSASS